MNKLRLVLVVDIKKPEAHTSVAFCNVHYFNETEIRETEWSLHQTIQDFIMNYENAMKMSHFQE